MRPASDATAGRDVPPLLIMGFALASRSYEGRTADQRIVITVPDLFFTPDKTMHLLVKSISTVAAEVSILLGDIFSTLQTMELSLFATEELEDVPQSKNLNVLLDTFTFPAPDQPTFTTSSVPSGGKVNLRLLPTSRRQLFDSSSIEQRNPIV